VLALALPSSRWPCHRAPGLGSSCESSLDLNQTPTLALLR